MMPTQSLLFLTLTAVTLPTTAGDPPPADLTLTRVILARPHHTHRPGQPDTIRDGYDLGMFTVSQVDGDWIKLYGPSGHGWARKEEVYGVDQSVERLTQDIAAHPNDASLLVCRAVAYWATGSMDKAMADATRAIDLDPRYALAYVMRARSRRPISRVEGDADLTKAVDLEPNSAEILGIRAGYRAGSGDRDAALKDINKAIALAPQLAHLYLIRAFMSFQNDVHTTLKDLDEAVRLDPAFSVAQLHRARLRRRLGQIDEALEIYRVAIAADPTYYGLYSDRAGLHYDMKNYRLSVEDYTAAIRYHPKETETALLANFHCGRGKSLYKLGEFEQAYQDMSRAILLAPGRGSFHYYRALCRYAQGALDAASPDLDEALRLSPKNGDAHGLKAWILACNPRDRLRDGREAMKHVELAIQLRGDKDAFLVAVRAACHAELGEFAEAVRNQEAAIKLLPENDANGEIFRTILEKYREKKPHREDRGNPMPLTPPVLGFLR